MRTSHQLAVVVFMRVGPPGATFRNSNAHTLLVHSLHEDALLRPWLRSSLRLCITEIGEAIRMENVLVLNEHFVLSMNRLPQLENCSSSTGNHDGCAHLSINSILSISKVCCRWME